MKISYKEGKQLIRMTERELCHFIDQIYSEILLGLPRAKEYVYTNGYEIYMKNLDTHSSGMNICAELNHTQLRFLKLFNKENKRLKIDMRTIIFSPVKLS